MSERAQLLRRIQAARSGGEITQAVAALDAYDRSIASEAQMQRELGFADDIISATYRIGPMHGDRHTAATDWLGEIEDPRLDYRVAMSAEASTWLSRLPHEVLADRQEFTAQALGRARTLASAYGSLAREARDAFLSSVSQQSSVLQRGRAMGASGLPQLDQVIDPNNNPSPTPYPTEVFPTFEDEQNQYNGGVETPNHDSEISSRTAPMYVQLEQMDGRGSGFGSGPERADEHTTDFHPELGYAQVPLGPEGQIPTSVAGPGKMPAGGMQPPGKGKPAPVTDGGSAGGGAPELDDDEAYGTHKTGSRYSKPDMHGFRWMIGPQPEAFHPYHEKCASSHWPDEDCTPGRPHVASVAIDHSMTLEQARHIGACESYGLREGLTALRASRGSFQTLAAHHNRLAAAWGASARSAEDTAVLRGFQAVVRPVLAEVKEKAKKSESQEGIDEVEGQREVKIKIKGKIKGKKASRVSRKKGKNKKTGKRKNKAKAKPQKQKDKGGAFPGAAAPFGKQGELRYVSNGFPMGDMRPAETLITGEQIGDQDHDYWDAGEVYGSPDHGGHGGGEPDGYRVVGSRQNFQRA